MNDFYFHLKEENRRFPGTTRISTIGMIHHKSEILNKSFSTLNFSLIFKGSGFYKFNGKEWVVRGPCVITQYPKCPVHYGPDSEWTELFIMYEPEQVQHFEAMGISFDKHPVWYLPDGSLLQQAYQCYLDYFNSTPSVRLPDIFDREMENVLIKSLHQQQLERQNPLDEKVKDFEIQMLKDLQRDHSLEDYCQQLHLNPQTFRRAWATTHQDPPHQFLLRQRVFLACRLLVETNSSISLISQRVGFDDALYFSRQFKKFMDISPREYRLQRQCFRPDT